MEFIRSYGSDEENVSTVSVPEILDSDTDSYTSLWSGTSSNYSITSHFSSFTSETNEIDEAVRNIMMDKDKDTTTDNNDPRHSLARFVIESMQEQVVLLKEEVTFLRIESNTKNSMIGQLMSENSQLRANRFKTNIPSVNSEFLDDLMRNRNRHTSSISLDSDLSSSALHSDGVPEDVMTHDAQLAHPERTTETSINRIPIRDPLANLWEDEYRNFFLRNPSLSRHPSNTIIAASNNQQPQLNLQQQQQQQQQQHQQQRQQQHQQHQQQGNPSGLKFRPEHSHID